MRIITTFCLMLGLSVTAAAHTLPCDESHLDQLLHQVFSAHHLPAFLILLVIGVLIFRRKSGARRRAADTF